MAKNKKEMTPEERLAAALVPEEEQPYELPEGWKWVYGTGFFLPMETEYPTGDSFRYIDIESIDNSVQRVRCPKNLPVKKAPSRASRKLHIGDTLFSMVRPYLKNIAYIDEEYSDCIGSTGFYVCTPTPLVDRHYLYWLMVSPFVVNGLNHFMKGDNSPSIRKGDIEKFVYPIPPLSEQHRLVARIESLFAKLDAAREKVQSVLDSHETRKAALLHAAFAGKLTAKWREENNKRACYAEEPLKNFVETQYGYTEKSSFDIAGPHYLRITDIQGETVDWNNVPNCSIDETNYQKYSLHPNDIVVARTGATTGKSYMIGEDIDAVFASYLIRVQITNIRLLPKFLYMFFQSQEYWSQIMELSAGIAQPGVNARKIQSMMICVPSLPEQQAIVRILDRLLAREQRARQAAKETLTAIDRMKQSILARAFRGEL